MVVFLWITGFGVRIIADTAIHKLAASCVIIVFASVVLKFGLRGLQVGIGFIFIAPLRVDVRHMVAYFLRVVA